MLKYLTQLDVYIFTWVVIYMHTLCMGAANVLASLMCADSPLPSLLCNKCTGLYSGICMFNIINILYLSHQSRSEERSGSVVECLTWDREIAGLSLIGGIALCPWARHFILCLVLVQPKKIHPDMTEQLLLGRKNSKQTNLQSSQYALVLKT